MSSVHWIFSFSKDVLFGGKKKGGGRKSYWGDSNSGNAMWHHLPLDAGSIHLPTFSWGVQGNLKARAEILYIMNERGISWSTSVLRFCLLMCYENREHLGPGLLNFKVFFMCRIITCKPCDMNCILTFCHSCIY